MYSILRKKHKYNDSRKERRKTMSLFDDVLEGKVIRNRVVTESTETEDLGAGFDIVTEAAYPQSIKYLKTMNRVITLPIGKPAGFGNLCFLYTNNTKESIELMNNKVNFLNGNRYYYYFYNVYYKGKLNNKNYTIKQVEERTALYKKFKNRSDQTGKMNPSIHPYKKTVIDPTEDKNMYFDLSKYIDIFSSICGKLPPKKFITIYWSYLKSILFSENTAGYTNRFVLINIDKFKLTKTLSENLLNPLYIIYYTMRTNEELLKELDLDFYFFTNQKCMKVNPSQCTKTLCANFKVEMTKLYSHSTYSGLIDEITEENTIKTSEAAAEVVGKINDTINKSDSTETITDNTIKEKDHFVADESITKKITAKVEVAKKEVEEITSKLPENAKITPEDISKVIETRVENEIDSDKELLTEIYNKNIAKALPKSAASTARDVELRKAQLDLKVGSLTVRDLQKVQTSQIKIPVKDVSNAVKTTNDNMKKIKFANYERLYNEKLMPKDITDAILALNNKSIPMFVRNIEIKDTSDELNYKDTYTVYLEDANRQRHTIKVDIPKFIEDKFLYIGGNKKLIKKQAFLYPVVKTDSDIVQVVTNYNKMFIQRTGTKSIASIERLKTTIKKYDELKTHFIFGNALSSNSKYVTTIEYDELSKMIIQFKHGKCILLFDQMEATALAEQRGITIPENHMFIGLDVHENPIFIDIDTQMTADKHTIVDIILSSGDETLRTYFDSVNPPKRLMYTRVKVMQQFMAVGLLLGFWEGLSSILKKANVKYRLQDKPGDLRPNEDYLKFANCYLVYESTVPVALLLNAFKLVNTAEYNIEDMDSREPYMPYLIKVYGRALISNALLNVYEFMIDPITMEVLTDLNLPKDIVSLIIYAVSLLADSQYTPEINQGLSRIRSNEIVPAILYERLAKNYIIYRNSNGKKKFSIPQDCVIKEVLALKTVEDYSTLNPTLELEMTHGISTKGFRGANLDESYTMEKRSFDPTMTGVIAPSTSPDGSVGVNKTLTMEPSIVSLRGYVDLKNDKLNELHDVNLFSPGELSIPLGATRDDPTRLGHALKQSKHVIPVKKSSPVLISNGLEEVCRFHLSSDFAVNADEDGEVIDYDDKSNIMVVKYKSGKHRAIDLGHTIVKNGGGGFFLSNKLVSQYNVGDKFKKDAALAYHKDFFTNDRFNNCRMNMGTMTKVAFMSTYNTYQDATMITEKLSDDASTEMCFVRQVSIGKNSNVEYMVKKGQEIKVGESLIQFDTSYEDNSLNMLLASLSAEGQQDILSGSRNDIHSKYSGTIEDIKIYSTVELDDMSPSLRKIVKAYYNQINEKKTFLEKYDPDSKNSIVKCGILMNDTTKKIEPNKFGVIKGQKIEEGVMIEFYVKHSEPLEIGSKIA